MRVYPQSEHSEEAYWLQIYVPTRSIRLLFSDEMHRYERTVRHDNLLLFFLISFCLPSPSFDPFIILSLCGTRVLHLTCPLDSLFLFLCLCQSGRNQPSGLNEEHHFG